MELFSIRIQRTFQLVSTEMFQKQFLSFLLSHNFITLHADTSSAFHQRRIGYTLVIN